MVKALTLFPESKRIHSEEHSSVPRPEDLDVHNLVYVTGNNLDYNNEFFRLLTQPETSPEILLERQKRFNDFLKSDSNSNSLRFLDNNWDSSFFDPVGRRKNTDFYSNYYAALKDKFSGHLESLQLVSNFMSESDNPRLRLLAERVAAERKPFQDFYEKAAEMKGASIGVNCVLRVGSIKRNRKKPLDPKEIHLFSEIDGKKQELIYFDSRNLSVVREHESYGWGPSNDRLLQHYEASSELVNFALKHARKQGLFKGKHFGKIGVNVTYSPFEGKLNCKFHDIKQDKDIIFDIVLKDLRRNDFRPYVEINHSHEVLEDKVYKIYASLFEGKIDEFGARFSRLVNQAHSAYHLADYYHQMQKQGYPVSFPSLSSNGVTSIEEMYHPVLTGMISKVIPNNVEINPKNNVLLITGVVGGGKTTYLKALGLSHLLGQAGFPILARKAIISPRSSIVTHFVSPGSIEESWSRFMSELHRTQELETHLAKPNALVLMDEPYTGSSHQDGLELNHGLLKLFSGINAHVGITTHMHELPQLAKQIPGIHSLQAELLETKNAKGTMIEPTFHITEGIAGKSYGIQMARQLGIHPDQIIERFKKKKLMK